MTQRYPNGRLLCGPSELEASFAGPGADRPIIIDLRPAERFATGRLPGAVHLDLFGVSLIDTSPAPLRAFLWMIEHLLASRGVSADRGVVVYDEQTGLRAARAFWFLEYFDHPDARVLDGGFQAWAAGGRPTAEPPAAPAKSGWRGRPRPDRLATWEDVLAAIGRDTAIVDTRSEAEYLGRDVRAARGGAIPGAVHVEWRQNLDADGRFRPVRELAALYRPLGVTPEREAVMYCQGGYRAAHTYLALRLLGHERVRNYLGSWKEWGDRLDLPIEMPADR